MASGVHKFLRNPTYQSIIRCFNHQRPPNLGALNSIPQPCISQTKHEDEQNVSPILGSLINEKLNHYHAMQIYPSFPFGYCLNPISPSEFSQSQSVKVEGFQSDQSRMVWADSVKKKRKRKMNKHKYRKLRKRLSRQT